MNRVVPDGSRPEPHPEPPPDLAGRPLPLRDGSGPWYRCRGAGHGPLHFGRTATTRFAAPAGQFGVLYAATDPYGAFIETFGQSTGRNLVSTSALAARLLTRIESARTLALVDLTGPGLARIGADGRLGDGDHAVARRWALACWSHPSRPDGLYYRARHDPSRFSVGLFDRVGPSLRTVSQGGFLDHRNAELLADILDAYRFGLRESG